MPSKKKVYKQELKLATEPETHAQGPREAFRDRPLDSRDSGPLDNTEEN